MFLVLLSYFGSDRRDGHVEGIHLLNFRTLEKSIQRACLQQFQAALQLAANRDTTLGLDSEHPAS